MCRQWRWLSVYIILASVTQDTHTSYCRSVSYLDPTAFPSRTVIVRAPSISPTYHPSFPSAIPSELPTALPTNDPTYKPSIPSPTPSEQPTPPYLRSEQPTVYPSGSMVPTVSTNNTYVGFLSYRDPSKCKKLHSFEIYPTSACLVMANTRPDGSAFISGHKEFSCGTKSASVKSFTPTDTTCSESPYDEYPLPDYGKCPVTAETRMYTCLTASSVTTLSKSVKGVVNT